MNPPEVWAPPQKQLLLHGPKSLSTRKNTAALERNQGKSRHQLGWRVTKDLELKGGVREKTNYASLQRTDKSNQEVQLLRASQFEWRQEGKWKRYQVVFFFLANIFVINLTNNFFHNSNCGKNRNNISQPAVIFYGLLVNILHRHL